MKKRKILTITGIALLGATFISSCDLSNVINPINSTTSSGKITFSETNKNSTSLTTTKDIESENKTIKFYNTCGETLQSYIQEAIDSFESKYPDWLVESVKVGGYDDVYSTNMSDISNGIQCNISYCYSYHVADYIKHYQNGKNVILDLNDYIICNDRINGYKVGYTTEELNDFVKGFYNEGKATNFVNYSNYGFDSSSILTMPFVKATDVMYVNTTALVEAGIVDEKGNARIPTTWDELWEAVDILMEKYPNSTPFCLDSESNWLMNMCKQNGWNYLSSSEPYYTFKDDENLANWMDSISLKYNEKKITTQTLYCAFTSSLFIRGAKTGCVFDIASSGGATYQYSDEFEWAVAKVPGTKNGNGSIDYSVNFFGPSLCMFDSGNDKTNLMTWLFLKELLKPEFQSNFSQHSGYNPCRLSTYELYDYSIFTSYTNIWSKTALLCKSLTSWYYTTPILADQGRTKNYIGNALVSAINGTKTGNEALLNAYNNCIFNL